MEAMPLARLADRLVREERRVHTEERRRRHELWVGFISRFFTVRAESEPPIVREEYLEKKAVQSGKAQPKEPTFAEWQQQEQARRSWAQLREKYLKSAMGAYYFEELAGYPDHLFDEPQEAESKVMTAQEIKEWERSAERQFVDALAAQVERTNAAAKPPSD